eukprot:CAMPEP_0198212262 /NCGR_PEP_ID=MMETSP1445-20131203/25616_1 /TAXON_ID=36898 /ORGANISM="Pyramimonas sp., Strain CCMP2087" /LENGTH=258 /DNA_ID=CAMNT_0043886671 /DNA_START=106 /DNA_END=882 /DNA_ORIENTATION=-
MTVRLGAPSHGKFLSTKAVRGHRSVANKMVTRAIFDKKKEEAELPKAQFVPRRLTPLPSDFGAAKTTIGTKKEAGSELPPPPSDLFSDDQRSKTGPTTAATPFANTPTKPKDRPAAPAASPFAAANKPAAPAASPFAKPPTAPGPNPVAGASKPKPSPFAAAGAAKPAASPFATSMSKSDPFGGSPSTSPFSAADVATRMAPIDKKKDMTGKPILEKIKAALPSAQTLFLLSTFGSIIALMLATTWVVVALGGVRLNN